MKTPSAKTFEIVDITRRCFPKNAPITVTATHDGSVTLRPGNMVMWRELGDVVYMLRNAHWFRKLTVYFIMPEDKKHGGN